MAEAQAEFHDARRAFQDRETGREVWQMTCGDGENVAPYMYAQAMTPDERHLCFESTRGGSRQLYRLEVATGRVRQLTECREYQSLSLNMRPGSHELMFGDGLQFCAVHVGTGERRVMVDFTGRSGVQSVGGVCVADARGERMAFQYTDRAGRNFIAVAATDGSMCETVFEHKEGLQHVLINPAHPDVISFAVWPDYQNDPRGTAEHRARAWLLDARTGEARPNVVMPPGCRATHEYWAANGERMYFHKKTVPGWIPTWIDSIDINGGDEREHFATDSLYLGHSCANRAETRIVSDEQRQGGKNVLLDIDAKARTARTLCWPDDLLGEGVQCHVHPSLSPSERHVVYTSNVTGRAQVYMTALDPR